MTQASRIDVFQSDRGLQSCLAAANINRTWADSFVKQHSVDTLEDFCYLVRSSEWERAIEDLVQATPGLKDNRIAAARFKAAYETGMQAIKQASQMAKAGPEALDEPLPEATNSQLSKDFKSKYGMELDPFLDPCDALRKAKSGMLIFFCFILIFFVSHKRIMINVLSLMRAIKKV